MDHKSVAKYTETIYAPSDENYFSEILFTTIISTKSFIKLNIFQFLLYLPRQKAMLQSGEVTWLHPFPITFFHLKKQQSSMRNWIMDWWKGISPNPIVPISFIYMFMSFILEKLNRWKGNNNDNLAILLITVFPHFFWVPYVCFETTLSPALVFKCN